jgi:hypothetical protein
MKTIAAAMSVLKNDSLKTLIEEDTKTLETLT